MPDRFDLETFRTRHFDYKPGHHVAGFGPTQQAGKTTTMFQLLDVVAGEEISPVVLCMKHRDKTVARFTRELGFRETPSWPPVTKLSEMRPFGRRPRGYTLWPPQSLTDVEADNARLGAEFRRAIPHQRSATPSVTFADEI